MKSLRKGISLVVSLTPCLVMAETQTDIAKELADRKRKMRIYKPNYSNNSRSCNR